MRREALVDIKEYMAERQNFRIQKIKIEGLME